MKKQKGTAMLAIENLLHPAIAPALAGKSSDTQEDNVFGRSVVEDLKVKQKGTDSLCSKAGYEVNAWSTVSYPVSELFIHGRRGSQPDVESTSGISYPRRSLICAGTKRIRDRGVGILPFVLLFVPCWSPF